MTRQEFHRIYSAMPKKSRAELIAGVVSMPSPLGIPHGLYHGHLMAVLMAYRGSTPGVGCGDNVTVYLGDDSEVQPDVFLRILPECGGQSSTSEDQYVVGPPELLVEVAHSSRAIDLHTKKAEYARHGVLEYVVFCVDELELQWFDLRADRQIAVPSDGIIRIQTFPGLWIDAIALRDDRHDLLMKALETGLATPEHAAFVQTLAARRAAAP